MTAAELIRKIAGLTLSKAQLYAPALTAAMAAYEINTPARINMFLAQIGHESQSFTCMQESLYYTTTARLLHIFGKHIKASEAGSFLRNSEKLANRVYANRMGNGNEASGDGYKYRGRGLPQLTGRDNHAAASKALGLDLLNNPDLLFQVEHSANAAAWFWKSRGCNELADAGKFEAITRKINNGLNGLEDRLKRLAFAQQH
jgi:putative chitinase